MPDTFIRFSDMKDSHPSPIDGANDLLAIAHKDINSSTGYNSMTVTPNALGAHAVEDQTFVNLETGAKTVEGAINQALGNFANKYDATLTYAVNDCVLYAGTLYKCIVAIDTPEAWDSTHWEQIKATDAVMSAYSHQYSTSEQIVGTWIDGTPVYEKTIYNAGGVSGNFNFPHGITNFGKLLSYEGTVSDSSFAQYGDIWVIPRIASDGNSIGIDKVSTSSIYVINPNAFGTRLIDWYITIRYTKTST